MREVPSSRALLMSMLSSLTTVHEDTPKKDLMSLTVLMDKLTEHHRLARQQRELYRAVALAPTPASRQELLGLRAYNNS